MGLLQGLFGNYSEISKEDLESKYAHFLIEGEVINTGFKLVRDNLIFTNLRIIDFDKQGATGKKMRIHSIYLDTICEVTCETAGTGIDDSEITITYIKSPYKKAKEIILAVKQFEFPKKFDVLALYVQLETIAYKNVKQLNA
ncbi:PH domain-containing protein [Lentisphaera profundi]|uniref:PH domain-containing protein n=1 Tax=Lentisphaera profundi TaxID=1658616 RepID=A0ABY7VUC0_9BACT|nr:PH domain-containing protein [Lentisphaera profundi]WDE96354.1 PH domain-containing protein [Lentisphaera profundi]